MQDFADDIPAPSAFKPILYGALSGLIVFGIFLLSYFIAPDTTLAGTVLIALALAAVVAIALNYLPSRAGNDIAAMAMGEAPSILDMPATTDQPARVSPLQQEVDRLQAQAGTLREELDALKRSDAPFEWVAKMREIADTLKELGTVEMGATGRKRQKAGLGHLRQASNSYRRVTDARGKNASERDWGVAQIAMAECHLVLGEAEGARDQVMIAVNAFTAGLEINDLSDEERRAGENGLAQAEGVLSSMAEATERSMDSGDEFY